MPRCPVLWRTQVKLRQFAHRTPAVLLPSSLHPGLKDPESQMRGVAASQGSHTPPQDCRRLGRGRSSLFT